MLPTSGLPLKGKVTVHWNDQMVPFLEADHDEDLAVALGVIHAHLRLGQMEVGRRAARGRIAEMGGPLATDIDHALRIIDFGKATPQVVAAMPSDSRAWLDGFVRGINHYVATTKAAA
jgi:penicillin amidase